MTRPMEEVYWRQLDIVKPTELPPVTVIGAGGIGSFTMMALAKMGCTEITVFDDDIVEVHNIPNQLYRLADIGKSKVLAAMQVCVDFSGVLPVCAPRKYDGEGTLRTGVYVSGVDSMAARKEIWGKIKGNLKIPLYIDARMGAEVCRIFTVNPIVPSECTWYEESLYSDEEARDEPCTSKATVYCGFMIAALVAHQVKQYAKGEKMCRDVIMDLTTMTFMTEEM